MDQNDYNWANYDEVSSQLFCVVVVVVSFIVVVVVDVVFVVVVVVVCKPIFMSNPTHLS